MQQHHQRRAVIAGSAAIMATGSVGHVRGQPKPNVIVIGAGLAGLNAALHLQDGGARVSVLEASSRLGGRIHTRRDLEGAPEGGAKQVHDSYTRTQARIRELGVGVFKRPVLTSGTGVHIGGVNVSAGPALKRRLVVVLWRRNVLHDCAKKWLKVFTLRKSAISWLG